MPPDQERNFQNRSTEPVNIRVNRLLLDLIHHSHIISIESTAQRQQRLEHDRETQFQLKTMESEDQRSVRLENDRNFHSQLRNKESTEQRTGRKLNNQARFAASSTRRFSDLRFEALQYSPIVEYQHHQKVVLGKMDKICVYCDARKFATRLSCADRLESFMSEVQQNPKIF